MYRHTKLAEHIFLNSQYNLLAKPSDKEIEADEQPLQGYYPLEVQAA